MKEYFKVSLTLGIVCGIVTLLLSYVYSVTSPIIEESTNRKSVELCKAVYDADAFEEIEVTDELGEDISKIYRAPDGGYVIAASGTGYGGDLTVMVGIKDGTVTGTAVLTSSETEGIGTRVEDESFASQFTGKTEENIGSVDTVAGATRSSKAYIMAVERAVKAYNEMEAGK